MKNTTKLITLILIFTLFSCGEKKTEDNNNTNTKNQPSSKTHDSVMQELVTNLEKMGDTVAQIKDIESASSTIQPLTKLGFKLKMLKTDMAKLGPPSPAIQESLNKKYASQIQENTTKIEQTMNNLKSSHPKAFQMIDKVMKTIM